MNDEINYKNNPLHGLSLKNMLIALVDHYGFDILHAYLRIHCFDKNPDVASSVKFLKKTDWAREKVESFYLYQYKNLPRCSSEQFELSPRDRIVPDGQTPGEPAELSLEDAERLQEKRARKAAEFNRGGSRARSGPYGKGANANKSSRYKSEARTRSGQNRERDPNRPEGRGEDSRGRSSKAPSSGPVDPWASARSRRTD